MSNEATITDEEEVEFLKLENDRYKVKILIFFLIENKIENY